MEVWAPCPELMHVDWWRQCPQVAEQQEECWPADPQFSLVDSPSRDPMLPSYWSSSHVPECQEECWVELETKAKRRWFRALIPTPAPDCVDLGDPGLGHHHQPLVVLVQGGEQAAAAVSNNGKCDILKSKIKWMTNTDTEIQKIDAFLCSTLLHLLICRTVCRTFI